MTFALPNIPKSTGVIRYRPAQPVRTGLLRPLARVRYQLLGGLLFAVLLPALLRNQFELRSTMGSLENSVFGTAVALVLGAYVLRRMLPYPGVQGISYILPTFAATYGGVALAFLLLRIDYSRFQILVSFILAVPWFTVVTMVEKHYKRALLAIVPFGNTGGLTCLEQADWRVLETTAGALQGVSGVVADFRADLPPEWEKLIARAALKGLPVYHSKHVAESLTGRVEIEHLSENSLGSLLPSSVYLKFKWMVDTAVALVALVLIFPLGLIVAFLIKREDGGPIFFSQSRVGIGGEVFTIFKFRTMKVDAANHQPFTDGDDPRITKVGKRLRRYRIDELPQVINILRGEMSWIGPRPESLPLAEWYESRIPFYCYRHIVRPGITGWAQVQQGYAAQVQAVTGKLHYDFFYIKHFSPWLDLLIVARTVRTVLTGFGSR